MRRKGLFGGVLACLVAFVMCVVLTGCSGGANMPTTADFAGTWDVKEITGDDATTSADMDTLHSMGMDCYLNLNKDGTAQFVLFGETLDCTWKIKDAKTLTLTADGSDSDLTYENDQLLLKDDSSGKNDTMVFVRGDAKEAPAATGGSSSSETVDQVINDTTNKSDTSSSSSSAVVYPTPIVVANDSLVTIEVLGTETDWADDPGYNLKITNNSDKEIYVSSSSGSFSVNNKMVDPYLGETIKPGAYSECFLYFSSSELGGGTEKLVNVDGELVVYDADWNELATYPFTVQ